MTPTPERKYRWQEWRCRACTRAGIVLLRDTDDDAKAGARVEQSHRAQMSRARCPLPDLVMVGLSLPTAPLRPLTPCYNWSGHNFSRLDRDGLVRCWYCCQLSPQSRDRLRAEDERTVADEVPS